MRWRILCASVVSVLIFCGSQIGQAADLSGNYVITDAVTSDGKPYVGLVTITKLDKAGMVYRLEWKTKAGAPTGISGIGLLVGDEFAVAWGQRGYGVVAYQMAKPGSLQGIWSIPAANGLIGTEMATGDNKGWSGNWSVVGTNPGRKDQYKGTLTISETEPYQLAWKVGKDSFGGVAILGVKVLAVGWGVKGSGVVHYTVKKGEVLHGRVALPGVKKEGIENLKKQGIEDPKKKVIEDPKKKVIEDPKKKGGEEPKKKGGEEPKKKVIEEPTRE